MSATTDLDQTRANEANSMITEIAEKLIGNRRLRAAGNLRPVPVSDGTYSDQTDGVQTEVKEGVRWA